MSKRLLGRLNAAIAAALFWTNGWTYEDPVHREMTRNAFTSAYTDPNEQLFRRLGITADQRFAQPFSRNRNALEWMIEGSTQEDGFPRPAYHFYDPISQKGLNANAVSSMLCPGSICTSAPDWAQNSDANNRNDVYSIPGARESFYNALTTTDSLVRAAHWATTFRAVGQIVHLIQDMAQPQHVRNDLHLSLGEASDGVLPDFSRYERVTRDQFRTLPYTGYNSNSPVKLSAWRKYWIEGTGTTGKGLAQFTNRYFISQGTNFDKSPGQPGYYELPSVSETQVVTDTTDPTDYKNNPILDSNGVPYTNVSIEYLTINYTDAYNGAFSGTNPKLATKSFFDFVHAQNTGASVYSMDNAVYQQAANILVPRAVGYSAGLIDYFFRGKLEISLPDEGVYGVVDHNVPEGNTKDTGGFAKIKVKLKNLTPAANGIEPMGPGKLVAVAKFHRNNCYLPNLSGEYGSPGINWRTCRSADEEIVVSQEVSVATITDVAQPVIFDFPNRVPINATDLYLQVVFRGTLGDETDAVVATKDISEPNYAYNYVRWDQNRYANYPSLNSGTNTWAQWCAQGYASLEVCNRSMGLTNKYRNSPTASPIPGYDPDTAAVPPGTWTDLSQEPPFTAFATVTAPVGTLARIAVLVDASPTNYGLLVQEWINTSLTGTNSNFRWSFAVPIRAATNQRDPATDTLTPTVTYLPGRGVYLPTEENPLLTGGNEPNIPLLILAPSQINF